MVMTFAQTGTKVKRQFKGMKGRKVGTTCGDDFCNFPMHICTVSELQAFCLRCTQMYSFCHRSHHEVYGRRSPSAQSDRPSDPWLSGGMPLRPPTPAKGLFLQTAGKP